MAEASAQSFARGAGCCRMGSSGRLLSLGIRVYVDSYFGVGSISIVPTSTVWRPSAWEAPR